MPASNIGPVTRNKDGSVTMQGAFTDMDGYKVTLFHIWLYQPQTPDVGAVGIAVSALNQIDPENKWQLTAWPDSGEFLEGAANLLGFAIVSPTDAGGPLPNVLYWPRTLGLRTGVGMKPKGPAPGDFGIVRLTGTE